MERTKLWAAVAVATAAFLFSVTPAHADGTGAGSIELRLQTEQAFAGGVLSVLIPPPGFTYDTETKLFSLRLSGGAGYFVTDQLGVGLDADLTYLFPDEGGKIGFLLLDPFVKFASNLRTGGLGLFGEASPAFGFLLEAPGDDDGTLFAFDVWGGLHHMLNPHIALQAGPFFTYLRSLSGDDDDDKDTWQVGARFGMSVYLGPL